jgi:hypothetical protein
MVFGMAKEVLNKHIAMYVVATQLMDRGATTILTSKLVAEMSSV